jgi:hypothetical protein
MKADTLTVRGVFGRDIRYVVPLYQRPYVWTKDEQWEPLWEDIVDVAEQLLDELKKVPGGDVVQAEERTAPHFLGAVVVDQVRTAVADIEARLVIDGQQRLTTLQLLLDAVQAVVAGLGDKRSAKLLAKLILNDEDVIRTSDDVFKVWPTNMDRDAYRAVMDDAADPATFADSPIMQAHEFFMAAAEQWIGEPDEHDEQVRRISALSTTLQGLLQIVVIDLEPHDNAQAIFETLNARGTPLLNSDLVKNLVLQAAERRGLDVEALYQQHWSEFDSRDYWRAEVRQGRLTRPRVDMFLYYWLIMRRTKEVSSQQVFPVFRKYLENQSDDVQAVLADLDLCGRAFRSLDAIDRTSREGTFIYRWRILDAQALTPVILWLFVQPESALPASQRLCALEALESWLVRRSLCRLTTKDYNHLGLELASRLAEDVAHAGDITEQYLAEQTADSRVWPSDHQLLDALLTVPLYSLLTRSRLRMVLEGIEDSYRGAKTEEEFVPKGKLTIEHLLPQTWRPGLTSPIPEAQPPWPLIAADGEAWDAAAAHRDRLLHTLGNLSLVTKALNPALSNSPWSLKHPEIAKHSVLLLNKHLVDEYTDRWDDETIERRGRALGARAIQIWRRPAT